MTTTPPDTLIIGMINDDPFTSVEAFTSEDHALAWIERHRNSPARRQLRLWRVQLTDPIPLVIVPPTPARLVVEAEIVE